MEDRLREQEAEGIRTLEGMPLDETGPPDPDCSGDRTASPPHLVDFRPGNHGRAGHGLSSGEAQLNLRRRLGGAGVVVEVCLPPVLLLHVSVWNVHVIQCGMVVLVHMGG